MRIIFPGLTIQVIEMDTLQLAKNNMRQGMNTPTGVQCPCCGQLVKLYRRKIHASMVRPLISLYHHTCRGEEFVHYRKLDGAVGNPDYTKLAYWALIEPMPNDIDPAKKDSGSWKLTDLGIVYVRGNIALPKYKWVFNGTVHETSTETASIHDAIGDKFDYAELMGNLL